MDPAKLTVVCKWCPHRRRVALPSGYLVCRSCDYTAEGGGPPLPVKDVTA